MSATAEKPKTTPAPLATQPLKPERYRMPKIAIGDQVMYYVNADRSLDPRPAFVTALMEDHINISVFEANCYSLEPRDGVRHVSDPTLKNPTATEGGSWDYSPTMKRLYEMERIILAVAQEVGLKESINLS